MGVLEAAKSPKQKDVRMKLGDSLAMLGLQHAHVVHEADPDTKVWCQTLRLQSWPDCRTILYRWVLTWVTKECGHYELWNSVAGR